MSYYFIDIENVGDNGFQGYEKLTKGDNLVIFYRYDSQLSKKMKKIIDTKEFNVITKKIDATTKNAIDFNIIAYLGYLIGCNSDDKYYVITRDNGYKTALSFLRTMNSNVLIQMLPNISNTYLSISKKNRRLLMEEKLRPIKADFETEEQFDKIVNLCVKSSNLSELNNKVVHTFKKNDCSEIYSKIKPYYEEIMNEII